MGNWTELVWANAEKLWIARIGQDYYYRDNVTNPGLRYSITKYLRYGQVELVDLGSGDAYCTVGLLSEPLIREVDIPFITLIDRSRMQLDIACSRPKLERAVPVISNFLENDWHLNILSRQIPRIFISTFLVQELPVLSPFLRGLRCLMSEKDIAFILTVAPDFSDLLQQRGLILNTSNASCGDDWKWSGLYPIESTTGRFFLPHFQRSESTYEKLFKIYDFHCLQTDYLTVPTNRQSISIFKNTIYGKSILETPSSVIFTLRGGLEK
ncbi:MAG: hypothetical protein PHO94_12515 [Petrimonas sp.]|nr:hypothetical protein [Petrimonas sp.]